MTRNTLHTLLDRLQKVKKISRNDNRFKALCPAHDDTDPSLFIRETDEGKILLNCKGGCDVYSILHAINFEISDLFPDGPTHHRKKPMLVHSQRTSLIPTQESYYRTVLAIADIGMKINMSQEDSRVVREARAYFGLDNKVTGLDYFESKRNRGEKLTAEEMRKELEIWKRTRR